MEPAQPGEPVLATVGPRVLALYHERLQGGGDGGDGGDDRGGEAVPRGARVVRPARRDCGREAVAQDEGGEDSHREAAHEDLPPQSPVYEYGASESSDETYSDEERGPSVIDQPPAAVDIEMAEANVINEDDSGHQDDSDSDDADDADSDSDDSDEDSEGSDASEVTS